MNFDNYSCDDQMSLFDIGKEPVVVDKPIKLIELFAGIGTQAMSLRDIGADFEHHRVVEFDKYACKSYSAIHGIDVTPTDIRDIDGKWLGITEPEKYTYLLTYSFPCQDLSLSGHQRGLDEESGTRSSLLWEVKRLLQELYDMPSSEGGNLPQILIMENVTQVHGKKAKPSFDKFCSFLEGIGYSNHIADLNAKDYGVAQNRLRCFMVSILGDKTYEFPKPIKLEKTMKDYLEPIVDEKYYINSGRASQLIDKLILDGKLPGAEFDATWGGKTQ